MIPIITCNAYRTELSHETMSYALSLCLRGDLGDAGGLAVDPARHIGNPEGTTSMTGSRTEIDRGACWNRASVHDV